MKAILRKLAVRHFTFLDVLIVAVAVTVVGNLQNVRGWPWWAADLAVFPLGATMMSITQAFARKRRT